MKNVKITKQGLTLNSNFVTEFTSNTDKRTAFVVFQDCESGDILSVQTQGLWFEPAVPAFETIAPEVPSESDIKNYCLSEIAKSNKDTEEGQDEICSMLQIMHVIDRGEFFANGLYVVGDEYGIDLR